VAHPNVARSVDGGAVAGDALLSDGVGADQQHAVGTRERGRQRGGIGEVAETNRSAALCEIGDRVRASCDEYQLGSIVALQH
jgi:hypothetical protein